MTVVENLRAMSDIVGLDLERMHGATAKKKRCMGVKSLRCERIRGEVGKVPSMCEVVSIGESMKSSLAEPACIAQQLRDSRRVFRAMEACPRSDSIVISCETVVKSNRVYILRGTGSTISCLVDIQADLLLNATALVGKSIQLTGLFMISDDIMFAQNLTIL